MLGGHLRAGSSSALAMLWRAALGGCCRLSLCMSAKVHALWHVHANMGRMLHTSPELSSMRMQCWMPQCQLGMTHGG